MRKLSLLTVSFLLAGTLVVAAATPWDNWLENLKQNVVIKQQGMENVRKDFLDVQCPKQANESMRVACNAAYNLVLARRAAEKAQLEFLMTTVAVDPANRSTLVGIVPAETLNEEAIRTKTMFESFDKTFSSPKKTTQR